MTEQDYLRQCFEYNPETGDLTWKERPRDNFLYAKNWKIWNIRFANRVAGSVDARGYRIVRLDQKPHLAHRIAWVIMTGSIPEHEIDHIDHNPSNNSWLNLRAVTGSENQKNRGFRKNNTSGITGVSWSKTHKNWRADVQTKHGRFVEHFNSFDAAAQAVLMARQKRNFHENHGKSL